MSTGEYYAELENNHHYIIVDEEHDRTYYCPAEAVANDLSRILNDKNKTIRELNRRLYNIKHSVVFEIERKLDNRDEHVAFVTNEELAWEFCDKHKDCYYHEIHITKYRNELEAKRGEVPCCGSCDNASPQIKSDGSSIIFCKSVNQEVTENEYCCSWEHEP